MKKIQFSHLYTKLLDENDNVPTHAILLEVFVVNLEDLSDDFLNYDTVFFDNKTKKRKYFSLPCHGKYIVLLFKTVNLHYWQYLFTTIRRFTPRKYEYYRNSRGDMFEIVITDVI